MVAEGSHAAERHGRAFPRQDAVAVDAGLAAELRDVLAHLHRRRRWIALAGLVMALVGVVLAQVMPRLFTATAQILVDPRGLRVFDNDVVPGGQLADVQSTLVETQAKVLKSDSVLQPVVGQEHLADDPDYNGAPRTIVASTLRALKRLLHVPAGDPAATALAMLGDAVKVQRIPGSFVIELSVASRDAAKAARLAQAITDTFIAHAQQTREDSSKRVSEGLAMRLDALGAAVKAAETAVDTFRRQNNIVDTNGRPLNEQQLGDLTTQLTAARVHSADLRARFAQVQRIQREGGVPDATSEVMQSTAIQQLRARYAEVKQARDNLLTSLGPRHPGLLAATAQLQGVQQLIGQEIGRIAASTRNDYDRAKASEDALQRQVAAVTQETGVVNTAAIRLRELEREAQARRAVYESFLTRSRETREQGDLPSVNISVISPAAAPLKPGGLPAPLIVVVVAVFGASAVALLALALDYLSGRLMTPRQMSLATGLPMLALARRRPAGFVNPFARWRRGAVPRPRIAQNSLLAMQLALNDITPGRPPRIVLFLSGTNAAARSRVPLDLARAVGAAGDRVLLIDADGDRLTRPFDDGDGAEQRGWSPVKRTTFRNLSVLAWSGPLTRSLPMGDTMGNSVLDRIAIEHDVVFIHDAVGDAPARLRQLAQAATNIVLVVDADAASLDTIEEVRRQVGGFATKVDGFVWLTADQPAGRSDPGGRAGPFRAGGTPLGSARTEAV